MSVSDPTSRIGLSDDFWEKKPLTKMSPQEWEALCDGCGKCCLNKIEDEYSGEVFLTKVACRLFDDTTCRCGQYTNRHQFVSECIKLTPSTISLHAYWLPKTCAYLLLWQKKTLPTWHPLRTGTPESVHQAGVSIQNQTVAEFEVNEDEWEEYLIEEGS